MSIDCYQWSWLRHSLSMNYNLEIKKFIYSQYVYTGLRITAGVLIPGIILYHYDLLVAMMSIPLGALFVALTDNPGPRHHRINGMVASIIINCVVVCIAGLSHGYHWLIGTEIILFSLLFSLFAVYGTRANSIGLIGLIVFVINVNQLPGHNSFYAALHFTIGGTWYLILSLLSNTLRPYKPVQQLLGESLIEAGNYLHGKALFYSKDFKGDAIMQQLMQQQINIHNEQNELREIIFKTRKFLKESTNTGRRLTMIFLDSIDLFERIMTSQQDYIQLHKEFDGTGILETYKQHINILANALHNTGLAVQAGYAYKNEAELNTAFEQSNLAFVTLRKQQLNAASVEGFIKLRHILHSLQDLTERIKRLQTYTNYRQKISKQITSEEVKHFVEPSKFDMHLLLSNITVKSAYFRHALRLSIALIIGYIVSLAFALGHGYWILLTIATIVKPAYSLSRQRNIQRVAGTMIGAALGFLILYFAKTNTPIFIAMLLAMIVAYSFLRLQYLVSTAGITLYVLLNFHFLYPGNLGSVLSDRILDTVIGSAIAFVCSYFILPAWEHEQINGLVTASLKANKAYFNVIADMFSIKKLDMLKYKLARKEAFVSLANFSGAVQRMLSEPKSQQLHLQQYHQLVTTSHMLTSYIASLSYYAQQYGEKYGGSDFEPMAKQVNHQFMYAETLLEDIRTENVFVAGKFPMNKKVQQLLTQRKSDLEAGFESDELTVRKQLSEMKTITDQFQLINSIIGDEIKILEQIKD